MSEADALDIVQFAIWTVLLASGPAVVVAMVVGVGIALVQALTQVQEITLTFVPKIVAIMLAVGLLGPVRRRPDQRLHHSGLPAHRIRLLSRVAPSHPSRKFGPLVSLLKSGASAGQSAWERSG